MLTRLADRLILCPTTHHIPAGEKRREVWHFEHGQFEVWIQNTGQAGEQIHPDLFVLKFPGTGGRAERMSEHPAEVWPDLAAEVWTVNPPGYGGSGGSASLRYVTAVAALPANTRPRFFPTARNDDGASAAPPSGYSYYGLRTFV